MTPVDFYPSFSTGFSQDQEIDTTVESPALKTHEFNFTITYEPSKLQLLQRKAFQFLKHLSDLKNKSKNVEIPLDELKDKVSDLVTQLFFCLDGVSCQLSHKNYTTS